MFEFVKKTLTLKTVIREARQDFSESCVLDQLSRD